MSTETTIRCDRCSEVIDRDRTAIKIDSGPTRHRLPEFDLCLECFDALLSWLAAGQAENAAADTHGNGLRR
jgi:hypothetical protein